MTIIYLPPMLNCYILVSGFLAIKRHYEIPTGQPITGASNAGGLRKFEELLLSFATSSPPQLTDMTMM